MRNGILNTGILIMAGAVALGACGGRDQQPTAPPEYAEPAPPPVTEGQDTTQDNAMPPEQGMSEQGMARQEPAPGQILPEQQPVAAGPCPTDVQGTNARMEERPEGIAIAFTTTGDVAGVRLRVQRLADLHNQRHAERMQAMMQEQAAAEEQARADASKAKGKKGKAKGAKAGKGQTGQTGQTGDQSQTAQAGQSGTPDAAAQDVIARSHARVEETPDGARLVLTLMDPATIENMREPLRAHANTLAGPQCDPMSETTNIPPGATSQRAPRPLHPR
jgi:hypothetical protein